MKNIHVIPTDKPSRLWINNLLQGKLELSKDILIGSNTAQNIYITSDEEIGSKSKPCWCVNTIKGTWNKDIIYYQGVMPEYHYIGFKKIILTTDQDLIKYGVQAINDEFLEWFVNHPECEEVKVKYDKNVFPYGVDTAKGYGWYKIIIPTEEPKSPNMEKKTIEEAAEDYANYNLQMKKAIQEAVKFGAEWYANNQSEQMYSEEDLRKAYIVGKHGGVTQNYYEFDEWLKLNKKS